MASFLSQIADIYVKNKAQSLSDYCFIFPNKRSGLFFRQALSDRLSNEYIEPEITTISDFINKFNELIEATRFEQLFILFNEYKELSSYSKDFDHFLFWGDMLLNDFNDVDKYLINAKDLFTNTIRYKEINSTYLTDEQREVIKLYWGEERAEESINSFWTHLNNKNAPEGSAPSEQFLKLWEILFELYTNFRSTLQEKGLCYSGMAYRNAAECISKMDSTEIKYKRIIFVGFNILSTSEIKIFERLQELGIADFYWDYNPNILIAHNKASKFISKYIQKFKSIYSTDDAIKTDLPRIIIKAVPSDIGQTKEAVNALNELKSKGQISDLSNAIDTAIVLPDENLFLPLKQAIPNDFAPINITMGYPLRYTQISNLVGSIISMHLNARKINEIFYYFHEDVLAIISHPYIASINQDECKKIKSHINKNRLFSIPVNDLIDKAPNLKPIFAAIEDINTRSDVFNYMDTLLRYLHSLLKQCKDEKQHDPLDFVMLSQYIKSFHLFRALSDSYNIEMTEKTFFHLMERAVGSDTINFVGEPLCGLQIMGVLETRAIDFKNLILLSMNERIFPRKHFSRSFIPNLLRKGYGMSTIEHQECIYAYYFYRMISRAQNVYLFYDSRQTGGKSGEMSRYIQQLLYLYPSNRISQYSVTYDGAPTSKREIEVIKTPDIMTRLDRYRTLGPKKNLSASSINEYINCPLQFYFENVCDIKIDDDITDYMDSSAYGSIVHEVLLNMYKPHEGTIITPQIIDSKLKNEDELNKKITQAINHVYYKRKDKKGLNSKLIGESALLARIIKHIIKSLFEKEKGFTPYRYIAGEKEIEYQWEVSDDITINLRMFIDRIDRREVNGPIRIIDYKTGDDPISVTEFESIFDKGNSKRAKAIFQLFIYCNAYEKYMNDKGTPIDAPIQPMVYKLKDLNNNGLSPIKINKNELTNYKDYNNIFMPKFAEIISEIFNPNIPFRQAENDNSCRFCKFKAICGKE